ncbi:MAG: hypothetical protein AABY53_05320 [Bdellovibrionota bacterium]
MRHLIFLVIFILHAAGFAKQKPSNAESTNTSLIAPVLIKDPQDKGSAYAGVITAEPTPQRLDALTILRQELQRVAAHEQQLSQKSGVFKSVSKRFPAESMTFFIAIGGVTFVSMWEKSHGDPLAMERHILSLKDPIAHLSFYSFMQSQGFYMDFRTNRPGFANMDPATRKQMMTRLSYQGMAIGSLAASIVADLGQSIKMCTDKWISGKTDDVSLATCDEAWKQWTARGKFTQYFPQIMSLWAAQASVSLIDGAILKSFNKVTMSDFAKKILSKDFLVKNAYKITGADVALTVVPGGLTIKAIRWAGKLTKFGLFVGVDHFLSNYTYRPLNNLIRPLFFNFDAAMINKLWHEADQGQWDETKIQNSESAEQFEKEIENYGIQMQQWREHLNSDAEADLAGWLEMTKKILNQIDYSYKYYLGFASLLFESLSTSSKIENGELNASAADRISRYPMRTLPLYGVSTGPYKAIGGPIEDYYLLSPNELEKRQKEHILNSVVQYKEDVKVRAQYLKNSELKELNSILEKLLSNDKNRIASGLNDLNKISIEAQTYDAYSGEWKRTFQYSGKFLDIAEELKTKIGKAQPVVYPLAGYSQAFTAYSTNQIVAESADFGKWSIVNKYKFNKEADLMMYKIICGPTEGRLYKVAVGEINLLAPQFDPPTLLKAHSHQEHFCGGMRTTNDLYSTDINDKKLHAFLIENFNYEVVGDIKQKYDASVFEKWWLKVGRASVGEDFKKFDLEYKKIIELAYDNYFDKRNSFKQIADSINLSKYLPKSIDASIKAETRFYLQLLARATTQDNTLLAPKTKSSLPNVGMTNAIINKEQPRFFNYLEFTTLSSQLSDYITLYQKNFPEVEQLNTLLNDYAQLMQQPDMKFNSYIAHSKKIDNALNDILVLGGLKTSSTDSNSSEATEDLSAPAAEAVAGIKPGNKSYEDVLVENPTYKQRIILAAVRGLKQVESEIKRFIRMKALLSLSLQLDNEEFSKEWSQTEKTTTKTSKAQRVSPFGPK